MAKKNISGSWGEIFADYNINNHDFDESPFLITATQINKACQDFTKPSQKEVRLLCKQDRREDRPQVFIDKGLFLLPVKNGEYVIIKGEGYVDIPQIKTTQEVYISQLDFNLNNIS